MQKILLIDGNNFMYAAQHFGRKLSAAGVETTAIFGFLNTLRETQSRFPDATPIVLWDSSPSWRVGIYPEYKGNRKVNPTLIAATEALRPQRPIMKDLLNKMGIRQYEHTGLEADDLAAILARKYSNAGGEVILITRDGDWQQLVNDKVSWYDHKTEKTITLTNFQTETGYLDPARFVHGKAIHGDTSDNIPGVGGLGEGAAALILSEFASLSDLAAAWPVFSTTLKGTPWAKYRGKIQAAFDRVGMWERYDLNLRLMNLRTHQYDEVPFKYTGRYDEEAVRLQFARLGFHSILGKYERWLEPLKKGMVV